VQAKQCLELTQKTLSATQPACYVENGAVAAGFRRFVAELISRTAARVEPSSIVRFDISPGAFQTRAPRDRCHRADANQMTIG